jgi:hypothetical protein
MVKAKYPALCAWAVHAQFALAGCGKSTLCHPERSEGSAFLFDFQETADSSGKHRPSE